MRRQPTGTLSARHRARGLVAVLIVFGVVATACGSLDLPEGSGPETSGGDWSAAGAAAEELGPAGAPGVGDGSSLPDDDGGATAEGGTTPGADASPTDLVTAVVEGRRTIADLSPDERLVVVYGLWDEAVETDIVWEVLADALDAEAANPTPGDDPSWFSATQVLMQAYATGLPVDEYTLEMARERMRNAPEAARPWYLVAIGYAWLDGMVDDPAVEGEIVDALAGDPDPAVAMHLMNLVGELGLIEATDTLTAYLDDPLAYSPDDLPDAPPRYPLRDAAAGALRRLGHTVYVPPDQPGTYVLVD